MTINSECLADIIQANLSCLFQRATGGKAVGDVLAMR